MERFQNFKLDFLKSTNHEFKFCILEIERLEKLLGDQGRTF